MKKRNTLICINPIKCGTFYVFYVGHICGAKYNMNWFLTFFILILFSNFFKFKIEWLEKKMLFTSVLMLILLLSTFCVIYSFMTHTHMHIFAIIYSNQIKSFLVCISFKCIYVDGIISPLGILCADGQKHKFSWENFYTRAMLVNFTNIWCHPCWWIYIKA